MGRSVSRLQRALLALTVASVAIPVAAEDAPERRSIRQLASELAERFGEDRVELRVRDEVLRIEPIGRRISEEPALFTSRISSKALVSAMNREREARGLQPLRPNRRLSLAAGDRLEDMFELRYFAHVSPDGREPFEVIQERGYAFSEAGENLAAGFASADAVVSAWMKSPGHRENLLSPSFEEVGVAVCDDAPADGMRGHTFVAIYGAE